MATLIQQTLAQNIVKNATRKKKLNKQELVVSSGYGEISADRHATEIIESKGVQEELKKLGFTSENAKRVVGDILDSKKAMNKDRLTAAKLIFQVNRDIDGDKEAPTNVLVNLNFG